MLLLLGENDDMTPAKPCIGYADDLAAEENPVTYNIYRNAYHVFDRLNQLPGLQLSAQVRREINPVLNQAPSQIHNVQSPVRPIREVHRSETLVRRREEFDFVIGVPRRNDAIGFTEFEATESVERVRDFGAIVDRVRESVSEEERHGKE